MGEEEREEGGGGESERGGGGRERRRRERERGRRKRDIDSLSHPAYYCLCASFFQGFREQKTRVHKLQSCTQSQPEATDKCAHVNKGCNKGFFMLKKNKQKK